MAINPYKHEMPVQEPQIRAKNFEEEYKNYKKYRVY